MGTMDDGRFFKMWSYQKIVTSVGLSHSDNQGSMSCGLYVIIHCIILEIFAKVTPGSRFEGETVHNVGAAVVVCGEL